MIKSLIIEVTGDGYNGNVSTPLFISDSMSEAIQELKNGFGSRYRNGDYFELYQTKFSDNSRFGDTPAVSFTFTNGELVTMVHPD